MALSKLMKYCSVQERCLLDINKKLAAWNIKYKDKQKMIDYLINENFLSEKRFVEAYVRGKFLIKRWGKNKIKAGLCQKNIFDNKIIDTAFCSEIIEERYFKTLQQLIEKKSNLLKENESIKKRDKIYRFMISKGYESDLIIKGLNSFGFKFES